MVHSHRYDRCVYLLRQKPVAAWRLSCLQPTTYLFLYPPFLRRSACSGLWFFYLPFPSHREDGGCRIAQALDAGLRAAVDAWTPFCARAVTAARRTFLRCCSCWRVLVGYPRLP